MRAADSFAKVVCNRTQMVHLPLRDEIPTPLHDCDAPLAGSVSVVEVSVVTSMNLKTKVEAFGGSMNLRRAGGGFG